jgi:hypothetical protein
MQVLGMPEELEVGRVKVRHLLGPVETQRTTVLQQPGLMPTFVKWMERPLVGHDRPLTIYSLDVTVPDDVSSALDVWRNEVVAAAGFLSMVLDERIAQEPILEDLVTAAPNGPSVYVDVQRGIRTFEPANSWFEEFAAELSRFQAPETADRLRTACRWYLRGAGAGPTPDGVVLFWIALESLVPPSTSGKARNQVRDLENAVRSAYPDLDPTRIIPPIGRLAGLRADIVHRGIEADPLIREAFYTLEALTRLLLRHAFEVSKAWAPFPRGNMLPEPLASMPRSPRTEWRAAPSS